MVDVLLRHTHEREDLVLKTETSEPWSSRNSLYQITMREVSGTMRSFS